MKKEQEAKSTATPPKDSTKETQPKPEPEKKKEPKAAAEVPLCAEHGNPAEFRYAEGQRTEENPLYACNLCLDSAAAAEGIDASDFTFLGEAPDLSMEGLHGFPWPVVFLIATAFMRHHRIAFAGAAQMPQDMFVAGSQWHITRYADPDHAAYTLMETPQALEIHAISKERDDAQARWRGAKMEFASAEQWLKEYGDSEEFAHQIAEYEGIRDKAKEIRDKAYIDFKALDEKMHNPPKVRKWRIDPTKFENVMLKAGIKAVRE